LERLMYSLINEGAWILEEGIAQRASDVDVIYVYGYGVPAYLGGPMFYADQIGLDKVYKRVCEFAEQDPASWKPAPLLKKLAESGGAFN
jgi:3-hydroxyacyl-CoA dehydrogenase